MEDYVTREDLDALRQELLCIGDDQTIMVEQSAGGQSIKSIQAIGGAGGDDAATPFHFAATKKNDTEVTIAAGRRRAGASMSTVATDDITVGATGYIYYELLYNGAYSEKFEWNANPSDQADDGAVRAFREDICKVTFAGGKITSVEQIWPGHVIGVDGRSV